MDTGMTNAELREAIKQTSEELQAASYDHKAKLLAHLEKLHEIEVKRASTQRDAVLG